jgi:glyoxylase-like metal-dependent hydrolase (beta-lactamase superfamily II)
MLVYSLLTPVTIELPSAMYRFSTAVTVVRTDSELAVLDTGFPRSGLEYMLHRLGFDPLDFTLVANTHFHVDHFGGNRLFRNARILMSREEYRYQLSWHNSYSAADDRVACVMASFPRLRVREAEKLVSFLDVVKRRYFKGEYFGDLERAVFIEDDPPLPSWLGVMRTPGHTPHHLSYLLKGYETRAIVTGDIIAGRNAYINGKVNFIEVYTDYRTAQLSVASLKTFADRQSGTIICPSHEGPFLASDGGPVTECPFEVE